MEQTQKSNTRYVVGEKLYVINFSFEGKKKLGFSLPFLYDLTPISKITIIELTVKEHHRVLGDWDDEDAAPSNDGFILEDQDGNIWYNQYPRASYGQLSDEGNRRFTRHLTAEAKLDELIENGVIFECHLINDAFNSICRGIKELKKLSEGDDNYSQKIQLLTKCKADIAEIFKKDFGKTFKEVVIWEDTPEITKFEVQDVSEETTVKE